jgi:hypothetical protein
MNIDGNPFEIVAELEATVYEDGDVTLTAAAESGNTNGGLKLNRLRLYRARLEVEYYTHITTGGNPNDLVSCELYLGMSKLADEIAANERLDKKE